MYDLEFGFDVAFSEEKKTKSETVEFVRKPVNGVPSLHSFFEKVCQFFCVEENCRSQFLTPVCLSVCRCESPFSSLRHLPNLIQTILDRNIKLIKMARCVSKLNSLYVINMK
jgi:hypothetical protein